MWKKEKKDFFWSILEELLSFWRKIYLPDISCCFYLFIYFVCFFHKHPSLYKRQPKSFVLKEAPRALDRSFTIFIKLPRFLFFRPPKIEALGFGKANIHPKSVNCEVKEFESQWLIYHEKMRTTKVSVSQLNLVKSLNIWVLYLLQIYISWLILRTICSVFNLSITASNILYVFFEDWMNKAKAM